MDDVVGLIAAIRRACKPGLWSAGVNLSRAAAVAVESRDAQEIVMRVRAPGRPVPLTVVLYLGEREWDCDCPGRMRPCEHIAAAAIAIEQEHNAQGDTGMAPAVGPATVVASAWARVVYRFTKGQDGLQLRRFIVRHDGDETPLDGTLAAHLAQPALARSIQVEQSDLKADLLLGTGARGALPVSKLDALLKVLAGARQVFLEGRPIAISDEEVLPKATVRDQMSDGGDFTGVTLVLSRDPRVTDVVSPGVVLCDGTLCRHGELELAGGWLQHLPSTRLFPPSALAELTARTLPELARRMIVDVKTKRVPAIVRDLPPKVVLECSQNGSVLTVLPKLVYGSPPCVRIDGGRMVHLGGPVPVRDEPAERKLVERLRSELNLLPGRRASFDGADTAPFVDKLHRWRGDLVGDAASMLGGKATLVPRPRFETLTGGDPGLPAVKFDLQFEVHGRADAGSARTVSGEAVVRAWREGLGLVPLDGGGWATLPQAWLGQHGARVADLLAACADDGRLAPHAFPTLAALCDDLNQPHPPGIARLRPLFEEFRKLPQAALPQGMTATLRGYQREGIDWLCFLRDTGMGGVLADDMGLGKTLQALCAFAGKTLVVAPTSVLPNWESEIARFRPNLRVCRYHGATRALDAQADVTLTTYAILRLDAAELALRPWDMAVLDEAQAIKNPDSQTARAAFALPATFRLALSGTPIENRLDELWSLMHFCNRGLLGGRRDFDDAYARPVADGIAGAAERLRQRIRPFVLRRLKREVASELPPRTESLLHVTLDERERAIYDTVRAAARADVAALLGGGPGVRFDALSALEALLRMRQAACHPGLLPGQTAATSSKVQTLVEALSTASADGHRALVFSQWTSLLDLIEPALGAAGIAFCRLDGQTRDRGAVVASFQSSEGPPVMLVSLKAGGTGLNLTAADHVFLCDPWWNPAVEAQAADRAHRIGQDKPVMVYRLVSTGTVEERIVALQEKKRVLFEAALGDATAAAALTREDLLALFE